MARTGTYSYNTVCMARGVGTALASTGFTLQTSGWETSQGPARHGEGGLGKSSPLHTGPQSKCEVQKRIQRQTPVVKEHMQTA